MKIGKGNIQDTAGTYHLFISNQMLSTTLAKTRKQK
jgi:hypothetical protein